MPGQETNKAVVRRFVEELWNRADFSRIDEIVAPNFVMHDPTGAGTMKGPAAVKKEFETERSSYPGGQFKIDEIISEGELVACRTTYSVRSPAPREAGARAAGMSALRGMNFFRVSKGRVTEEWWVYDSAENWWVPASSDAT